MAFVCTDTQQNAIASFIQNCINATLAEASLYSSLENRGKYKNHLPFSPDNININISHLIKKFDFSEQKRRACKILSLSLGVCFSKIHFAILLCAVQISASFTSTYFVHSLHLILSRSAEFLYEFRKKCFASIPFRSLFLCCFFLCSFRRILFYQII